ncbi:MAG: acyl-CoA dehydratase activase [Clostridiales bacterium]|nr:acyl-CoA dehydratase activase [Clostridiales bacterium]
MITAGIDVGCENIKIAILKDGQVIGRATEESGGIGRAGAVDQAWKQALSGAGIAEKDVEKVVATGKGKHAVAFADDRITEPLAACTAARFLYPGATAVMDAGADETLMATIKGEKMGEFVVNEKCAAGIGAFLAYMGRRLEMTPEEMGGLSRPGPDSPVVNDGCVVFADMEALGLLNRGASPKDVAIAVTEGAAVRASTVVNDITIPRWDKVVMVGGLAKNAAFVNALKANAEIDLSIPQDPEYAGALGAALFAAS